MRDQAEQLRERLLQRVEKPRQTRLITVTSGKGGVGKSNFTLNFALGLMERGQKVVIFDVDLGLANLDVLMGISAKKHLFHLLEKDLSIWDILEKGPNGLEFIAGGSGFTQIMNLEEDGLDKFFKEIELLQGYADTIFLDTGAGLSKESLTFMLSADEVFLVTTPEPTAITDAYAVIKMIHSKNPATPIRLVINRVSSSKEGRSTAEKLTMVAKKFLDMELVTLGFVEDDSNVSKAVKVQRPFLLTYPHTQASKGIRNLVDTYIGSTRRSTAVHSDADSSGLKGFLTKLKQWMK